MAGGGGALSCAGYGSLVTVTAPMGMAAAALALRVLNPPAGRPLVPAADPVSAPPRAGRPAGRPTAVAVATSSAAERA
ncbi:MAG: hypothetical protein IPM01_14215 [Burkholderiaceae bacterium]|nr:hypothetical protein [Burkholderiaceae bacterium]